MYDVFLSGTLSCKWREEFKSQISADISIYDPYLKTFDDLEDEEKNEQISKGFQLSDECAVVVFYLDEYTEDSIRTQIGDAIGRGKQVILCCDGEVHGIEYIKKYCEYHGVNITHSLKELILTVEEYIAELALCVEGCRM